MASPVDTSVKFFRSTMPGAPVLRGQVGSLIALLDACLVNGWGSQTASSVTIADGVATATFPSDHAAAVEAVVRVAGASTPAGINGEQKVIAVAPNVIKWATDEADGTATGTITVKLAPAGWSKVFSGTNLAVYKSDNPQAHGQFLRVNDTATTFARVVAYENMTAVSTGTGPFPTATQMSGGFYWGKSNTAGAFDIPWAIAADSRAFYYNAEVTAPSGAGRRSGTGGFFGDLQPHSRSGDPFASLLLGVPVSTWESYGGRYLYAGDVTFKAMPRKHDGVGTAIQPDVGPYTTFPFGALPNPVNGRIAFTPIYARDTVSLAGFRADLPGARMSIHSSTELALTPAQVFVDTEDRARLNMFIADDMNATSGFYTLAVDVTGPWR